jgi:hypothetical protein
VSTVLIGAGEGALDRSGCGQALLQAAAEAQEIRARVSRAKALLAAIEIVELFEDRAIAAWRAADQVLKADPALARSFEPLDRVRKATGSPKRWICRFRSDVAAADPDHHDG